MVTENNAKNEYIGLSTDEKPVEMIENAAHFFEMDTGKRYMFDEQNADWLEQKNEEGGGGSEYKALYEGMVDRTISGVVSGSMSYIGNYAFAKCSNITEANFPNVSEIETYAFADCASLSGISFPNAVSIDSWAFRYCYSLETADFPKVTTIGDRAFVSCTTLTEANFPNAQQIGSNAFANDILLTAISFPNAQQIGSNAFASCAFSSATFPAATAIGAMAFNGNQNLTYIEFGNKNSAATLAHINVFFNTPISGAGSGYIYVPSTLLSDYKAASNWSEYASKILSIPE